MIMHHNGDRASFVEKAILTVGASLIAIGFGWAGVFVADSIKNFSQQAQTIEHLQDEVSALQLRMNQYEEALIRETIRDGNY